MGYNQHVFIQRAFCLFCCLLITNFVSRGISNAQEIKYEAETGILTGSLTVQSALTGFSGTGYVGRFEQEGDRLTLNLNLAQAGKFNIYIGYAAPFGGQKINFISINGNTVEVTFPFSAGFRETAPLSAGLKAGSNTINITKSWGWFFVDYIRIEPNNDPEIVVTLPYHLVTPGAMTETQQLFSYLSDQFTKKIHSGTMSLNAVEEAEWLYANTGKNPALIGLDFMNHTRSWIWYDKSVLVNKATEWYNRNGLVAVCWHWRDPLQSTDEFYTDKTNFDVSRVTVTTSAEYQAMLRDMDIIAGYLKQLQDAKVPVLFRPLHEASGKWFWWGAKGPEPCKILWKLMFDRLVNFHGIKNLIWVWTTNTGNDALDWYPGDAWVDILGVDIYAENGDFSSQILAYEVIKEKFGGKKMITLSENGPVPDPDLMISDKAHWSWFMTWYGKYVRDPVINPLAHWQKIMNHEYVVTLDEMPDLRNYTANTVVNKTQTDKFRVYINPADQCLHIDPFDSTDIFQADVYDISGRLYYSSYRNNQNLKIPFLKNKPGVYFVIISTSAGFHSFKVVK